MTVNTSRNHVFPGNEGYTLNDVSPFGQALAQTGVLNQTFTTRGTIDLNEGRLPTNDDATVRPAEPLVAYNSFIVSGAGTAPPGVTGTTALNNGDLLVLKANSDATVPSSWMGVLAASVHITNTISLPYWGTNTKNVKVIGEPLPFFP